MDSIPTVFDQINLYKKAIVQSETIKKLLLLGALNSFSSTTIASIDYVKLERVAAQILCKQSPDICVPYKEPKKTQAKDFIVDGIKLPANALRDAEQQQTMIPAGLYIKQDGSVAQIEESDYSATVATTEQKSKVLPIKTFATPPPIHGQASPIIIRTGNN